MLRDRVKIDGFVHVSALKGATSSWNLEMLREIFTEDSMEEILILQ